MTTTWVCFNGSKNWLVLTVLIVLTAAFRWWLSGCCHLQWRRIYSFFYGDVWVDSLYLGPKHLISPEWGFKKLNLWVGCPREEAELFLCTSPLHLHTYKIWQDYALSSIFLHFFPSVFKGWAQCFLLTTHACKHKRWTVCMPRAYMVSFLYISVTYVSLML